MCGLAGFFSRCEESEDWIRDVVSRMGRSIEHRGPDDCGVIIDPKVGFGAVFQRLAILDLSPTGHQPMESASGRFQMMFNGEVYNYRRIADDLSAAGLLPTLRGTSDTEVMLAAIEAFGVRRACEKFVGMFAIVLWDCHERALYLIRDRVGVKPLYFAQFGNTCIFGSELKALREHPAFEAELDLSALDLYLRLGYIPQPHCIYRGVRKLPGGSIQKVPAQGPIPEAERFWTLSDAIHRGKKTPFTGSVDDAANHLEELLGDCIGLRMIADVPLGAFLSGGVDSSTVVALMQAKSSVPVKTFSIGFEQADYDEAQDAKRVATHLGTDHTELYVSPSEMLDVVPRLPDMFDEPFADSSQIPTFLVSQMARRHVTVSLSGDGGDELFGGYNRYAVANRLLRAKRRLGPLAGLVGKISSKMSPASAERLFRMASPILPSNLKFKRFGERVDLIPAALSARSPEELYLALISQWQSSPMSSDVSSPCLEILAPSMRECTSFHESMIAFDMETYMQEDILAKVDRASMAVSLEAREPLLDHRLIEFAWSLPMSVRVPEDRVTKHLLRSVLHRYVPSDLIERPKQGFAAPVGDWLRGPLREWAEDLLSDGKLPRGGLLDRDSIISVWSKHLDGKRNMQLPLWNILMFQAWKSRWLQ